MYATVLKHLNIIFHWEEVEEEVGGKREEVTLLVLHKLMWGDNLPHAAWVLCFLQCLRFGSCLGESIFVSAGYKACQIIIDASLESISYSTNNSTLAEIYRYQSDKTKRKRKLRGLTATGRKSALRMTDEMNKRPASWTCVLPCTCHQCAEFWREHENPPQVLEAIPSPLLFSKKNADRSNRKVLNLLLYWSLNST